DARVLGEARIGLRFVDGLGEFGGAISGLGEDALQLPAALERAPREEEGHGEDDCEEGGASANGTSTDLRTDAVAEVLDPLASREGELGCRVVREALHLLPRERL